MSCGDSKSVAKTCLADSLILSLVICRGVDSLIVALMRYAGTGAVHGLYNNVFVVTSSYVDVID